MKNNWLIIIVVIALLSALYIIEFSKVKKEGINNMPTLDSLQTDELSKNWEPFYKVRATIIDGQSASFSIPDKLKDNEGKEIELLGAVVFFGNGCEIIDDNTTKVKSFFLLPSLGLANACVLQPDVAMRWTIQVTLDEFWILSRKEMINTQAIVSGIFKIDTSKPFESVFFIESAVAKLEREND